ncbi:MAG TPA: single-stranded-DNA-specific exonuclease RecJ [Anaerolineae bacterium]|nr:single-stranded-DNA-specific exonuclease RecJ [Anaerolineae bacterium]
MTRPTSLPLKKWELIPPAPAIDRQNLGGISPILYQILYNRGLTKPADIQAFLEKRYLLPVDPFLLPDMDKAVDRIIQARDNDETVIIYGDFDADGVTSTVLLVEALRGMGFDRRQAQPYIPDRFTEGYGLNKQALTTLRQDKGASLIITVDCGIRSLDEVAHANTLGLDIIITDHHSLGHTMPPSLATINPKRHDSQYPERFLAGVGIAYKIAQALYQKYPPTNNFYHPDQLLDLVALGTVADLAPLLGENRQLVTAGLEQLNKTQRPGLLALMEASRVSQGSLTAESIGFALGPRINAAGRLDHAYLAARLLAAPSQPIARQLAQDLTQLNKKRQQLTQDLSLKAEELTTDAGNILIAADPDFAPGIVGLVASRLADKHYRPAIVIEQGPEESRGSCRSIPEFHITNALDQTADILVRHGGHAQAAGFTIKTDLLPQFQQRMNQLADAELAGQTLYPTINIDAEIALDDIDWALYEQLEQLEPTGFDNSSPVFMTRNVRVYHHRAVGQAGAHLQITVGDAVHEFKGIAFRQGAWANTMPEYIDITYSLSVNEWRGNRSLQLQVLDLRATDGDQ